MTRHTIVLRRTNPNMSTNAIETDAFNAMLTIPGVSDILIDSEEETKIGLSYEYSLKDKFQQTNEYLNKFSLERADWK